ncbi:MAG TPA: cytochrome b [Thauera sp.]|nr:cytochrome b [Thauera sp.]
MTPKPPTSQDRSPRRADTSYTSTAKVMHWLMAVLIPATMALGMYVEGLPFSPEKLKLIAWHKWAGVSLFLLVALRLTWRLFHPPPPLPASMAPALRMAAHAGHALLYVLMFAIPLTGWLMSSAKGVPTVWFGVVPIPDLLGKDEALGKLLQATHMYLNWLLAATLVGHIAAALKHHFLDRDDILTRMLPTINRKDRT